MSGGVEKIPAEAFEKLVAAFSMHPVASAAVGVFILLFMALRKDGALNRLLGYLEARSLHEAALENRRLEILYMIEERAEPPIPGLARPGEVEGQ